MGISTPARQEAGAGYQTKQTYQTSSDAHERAPYKGSSVNLKTRYQLGPAEIQFDAAAHKKPAKIAETPLTIVKQFR